MTTLLAGPPTLLDANACLAVTASGPRLQGAVVWVTQMWKDSAPSWLLTFCPQHHAVFPVPMPHVCSAPALIERKITPPVTGTGTGDEARLGSPIWPHVLSPQQ